MKTILITGASGFVGHHLCNKLLSLNYNVIALVRNKENVANYKNFYNCNLNNVPIKKLPNIDICFHLAANNQTQSIDESTIIKNNVYEPIVFFKDLLKYKNCKKFIYASSCAIYGNQPTPFSEDETKTECLTYYAKSKLLFENFAKNFAKENNIHCIGLRYSNIYGRNEKHKEKRASMIHQIIDQYLNNKKIILFKNGEQKRDWVYIDDVTQANLLAINYNNSGIFNIGSGVSVSFNQIVKTLCGVINQDIDIEYIDCNFADSYQINTCLDITKAKNIFGYFPKYSIEKGIKDLMS